MTSERRRYFRIDDTALLHYRVIAGAELELTRTQIAQYDVQGQDLRAALEPLELRLVELMPALRRESRVLAEAIELLNRKLKLLAGLATRDRGGAAQRAHQLCPLNLSGGGLALHGVEQLPVDSWLAIDLILLPGHHGLSVVGRVTDVREQSGCYAVGVEFDALSEQQRDVLVSHTLRKQAQLLRQERGGQHAHE